MYECKGQARAESARTATEYTGARITITLVNSTTHSSLTTSSHPTIRLVETNRQHSLERVFENRYSSKGNRIEVERFSKGVHSTRRTIERIKGKE